MESKTYLTIIIIISSFLISALYTNTGIMFSIFEKAVAQEGAITPEDSVNDTQIDTDRNVNDTQIDTDAGTTRSSPDFSALNDTATALTWWYRIRVNASLWATNLNNKKLNKDIGPSKKISFGFLI